MEIHGAAVVENHAVLLTGKGAQPAAQHLEVSQQPPCRPRQDNAANVGQVEPLSENQIVAQHVEFALP